MTFVPPLPFLSLVAGIKDEMKPKYHARPPPSPSLLSFSLPYVILHRIATTITGGGISIASTLTLECRELSHPLSFSFSLFSLATDRVERACCLPVKRQKIHPLLNQYCANLSATPPPLPLPPRNYALISTGGTTPCSLSLLRDFAIYWSLICRRRKVLSTLPLPPPYSLFFSPYPRYRSVCKY